MKAITALLLLTGLSPQAFAYDSTCSGADNWTASIAFVHLKYAGITDDDKIDFSKTEIHRLASEKIGFDAYQQVHRIIFTEKQGKKIEIIASNEVSSKDCAAIDVEVFVVSQHLGELQNQDQE